ncbi:MAG TPA: NUDIX hydrolase [Phycisphaerales bacterium]|nr:NUDIX hydrolase [Phycisphaerales bacterium]
MKRTLLRQGVKFDIELVERSGRDGTPLTREVIRHPGSVIILPLLATPSGLQVVLIENFRLSTESTLLELPAGTRTRGEDPAVCAARELIEETGYRASTLTHVTTFLTAPGLTDEAMAFFIAQDLSQVGQDLENDEEIAVRLVSPSDALSMIAKGEIRDAKTMLALLLAKDRGILPIVK